MATKVLKTISIYRQEGKEGYTWYREPGEESSQSYKKGAPLVYDSSTKELEIWAGGTDATAIVGIAAQDASGTAGTDVPIYEANDYNLFAASLINGTDAYTLLGTEIGKEYSLIASGNNWYVDIDDETTKKVEVVGLVDAVGDVNPRVIVRVLADMQANVQEA
ncbi:MAG: hypothetical protein PHW65_00070 [Dehalococcoidales bacterium]|nr:hypothetical protein [Dehalococcoidales bacterium]